MNTLNCVDRYGGDMRFRAFTLTALLLMSSLSLFLDNTEGTTAGRAMACSGSVCLNEAMPNPNGADDDTWPNGEWMEIYNSGTSAVNVLGWELENKASKTLAFDSTSIVGYEAGNSSTWTIQPGDYMVIARNGTPTSAFYLTNSFDRINLIDSFGAVVDQASWNSTSSGTSLEEDPSSQTADWVNTNSPTPGTVNSASTGPVYVYSDLIISEVMANPWPSADNASWPGGEWIEVVNTGSVDINLTGWTIVDNAGNIIAFNESHLINPTPTITPNEIRILTVNSSYSSGVLNNGGETIRLYWPNGSLAQSVTWTDTQSGFSLVDKPGSYWGPAPYPTPEQFNPPPLDSIIMGSSPIRISEVMPFSSMDGAPLPDGEWVELHNTGSGALDLAGWFLRDGMGNMTQLNMLALQMNTSQPDTTIDADGRRLVQFYQGTELWDYYNHLMLVDASGLVVSTAWWNTNQTQNVSLVEPANPMDAWEPAAWPTPGQPEPNNTLLLGDVIFNEIMPNSVGNDSSNYPDGEWIEIMNNGSTMIDLTNWHFKAGSRNLNFNIQNLVQKDNMTLLPGEITVVAVNGSSFYMLNTAPDTIELRDGSNQLISSVSWNSSTEGESLWQWQGEWSQAPWPTPGQANPNVSPYTGAHDIEITEILAHCADSSITPEHDWVELLNNGSSMIDLAGWRLVSDDGDLFHARTDRMWNDTSTVIAPDERFVVTLPMWFVSGYGGSMQVQDPDGVVVDEISWSITADCQTLDSDGQLTAWPTPGQPEPDNSDVAGPEDLIFSRFMYEEKSNSTNDEFFEISNIGVKPAYLSGWKVAKVSTGDYYFNGTFTSGVIPAGESVIISPDSSAVKGFGDTTILEATDVMDYPVWLSDSGSTIQLISPMGQIADSFVYGNGPTDAGGWNGVSISEPVTDIERIVYLRGDGCGNMPDTDSAADWQVRWSMAGASHFCGTNTFSDYTNVTPLIGPDAGLAEVVEWIEGAQNSIHLHVYQIHHPVLVFYLMAAQERGVEVTVVIQEPVYWWAQNEEYQIRGMMWEMSQAGIDVLQFEYTSTSSYEYLHSKVAVRDGSSVWIGSGNWKESTMPSDDSGNRDWGVIVDSTDLANIILERLEFDEDISSVHISRPSISQPPSGSYTAPRSMVLQSSAEVVNGPVDGELITCPDDCIEGLTELINSANESILLSLQGMEMNWYWGWQTNPLIDALHSAAERGIAIRLIINQHYADENSEIQEAVNKLNEDWGWDEGHDVEAILMSENETVNKLHNKGVIIDNQTVLISSINWNDNSILRNREMGLILHSQEITAIYSVSWWDDWNRLDDTTDSDGDGMPDKWEIENGLNRSRYSNNLMDNEGLADNDGDGLGNLVEYSYGSNPLSMDTDGDCLYDSDEILWASLADVSASLAIQLADSDGDGTNDSEQFIGANLEIQFGCSSENNQTNNTFVELDSDGDGVIDSLDQCPDTETGLATDVQGCSSQQTAVELDSDGDGIIDSLDECPDTGTGLATDTQGCSSQQNKDQTSNQAGEEESSKGLNFMLWLVVGGILVLIGAGVILVMRAKPEGEGDGIFEELSEVKNFDIPILDGTNPNMTTESGIDMSKFPGWDEQQVKSYLDSGWTEQQLAEWYQQQMEDNSA